MEADPHVGAVLQERYRVMERVSGGAMGSVYRAERLGLQRSVAVKFLHPAAAREEHLRKRFEVEARAMGRLSHPNCISVIDFGVAHVPYLVMELVTGKNLREVINTARLPLDRALHIGRQILAGLQHAHAQGIVHRDIKPENIVVQSGAGLEDHVRILDFGLAKLMDHSSALTVGMALGTPNYMAPEQASEGGVDERADLYATGILLFELITGKLPFHAEDVGEVLRRQLLEPPPRLDALHPELSLPAGLSDLVWRAMQKKPADRFASAQEMGQALDAILATPPATKRGGPGPRDINLTLPLGSAAPGGLPPPSPGFRASPILAATEPLDAGQNTVVDRARMEDPVAPEGAGENSLVARARQVWQRHRRIVIPAGVVLLLMALALVRSATKENGVADHPTPAPTTSPSKNAPRPRPQARAAALHKTTPAPASSGDRWREPESPTRKSTKTSQKTAAQRRAGDRWGGRWAK